jgi:uncharacterized protein YutD
MTIKLTDKFKNIPHIFYINSEGRTDLQEYTENNLINLGISNFTKISNSQFLPENFANWKHLVYNENNISSEIESEIALSVLYVHTIQKWLETTTDKYMIIMSDHVDYSYVEYFHEEWDWDYFMNNLPHDFDSILFGFEDKLEILPCFLHPMRDSHGTGMTLLNRRYAEKLVKFHYIDGRYNFFQKISNKFWKQENRFVPLHYFMNQCGYSYAIPMFPRNPELTEDKYFSKETLKNNKTLYSLWWKKCRDFTTLEQFHLYHSNKDFYLNFREITSDKSIGSNNINRGFLLY